jgi:hypothetical protein
MIIFRYGEAGNLMSSVPVKWYNISTLILLIVESWGMKKAPVETGAVYQN